MGSGGGSGGSVAITTQNLNGDTHISLKGGVGSKNGGGGGSGGRLVIDYLRSYSYTDIKNQSHDWTGNFDVEGGKAGPVNDGISSPTDGRNGTVHFSKCFPGYEGPFCKPCKKGWYKADYSYGSCQKC